MNSESEVRQSLCTIIDEDFNRNIIDLNYVRHIDVSGSSVDIQLQFATPACPRKQTIEKQVEETLKDRLNFKQVTILSTAKVEPIQDLEGRLQIPGVSHVILIGSGKGGVGKSTVSVNIAAALAVKGARVGLLDADIYGPSAPMLLKPEEAVSSSPDEKMIPAFASGVHYMSMGFLAQDDAPLIWRGPMAHKAIQQCIFDTLWGQLDYLIVDLPPGTGDVHLTLAQTVRVSGSVIISTPQDLGLTISKKTLRMFEKTDVPILGILENMSYYKCRGCNQKHPIFGSKSVEEDAKQSGVAFLGQIGIEPALTECSKEGVPVVAYEPESEIAQDFLRIAGEIAKRISVMYYEPAAA